MPILYALDFNSLKEIFNQLKVRTGVLRQLNLTRDPGGQLRGWRGQAEHVPRVRHRGGNHGCRHVDQGRRLQVRRTCMTCMTLEL